MLSHLNNDEGVYRTAPATPDLLKKLNRYINNSCDSDGSCSGSGGGDSDGGGCGHTVAVSEVVTAFVRVAFVINVGEL